MQRNKLQEQFLTSQSDGPKGCLHGWQATKLEREDKFLAIGAAGAGFCSCKTGISAIHGGSGAPQKPSRSDGIRSAGGLHPPYAHRAVFNPRLLQMRQRHVGHRPLDGHIGHVIQHVDFPHGFTVDTAFAG